MKRISIYLTATVLLTLIAWDAHAATKFVGPPGVDSPYTLETFGAAPGPFVVAAGGNPAGALVITEAVNGQNNFITFDNTDAGAFDVSVFRFDFLIDPVDTPSADGISFSYVDTATYLKTGPIGSTPFTPEDPAAAGVLGFGFDTWSNQGAFDDPAQPNGTTYEEISVFWNGALIDRIDDTGLLTPPLILDDGAWHTVEGRVDFANGRVDLNVDGAVIHSGLVVPGLVPFESRIMIAGRTGGENENAFLDNLNVEYVPEPSGLSGFILAAALIAVSRRRSRR